MSRETYNRLTNKNDRRQSIQNNSAFNTEEKASDVSNQNTLTPTPTQPNELMTNTHRLNTPGPTTKQSSLQEKQHRDRVLEQPLRTESEVFPVPDTSNLQEKHHREPVLEPSLRTESEVRPVADRLQLQQLIEQLRIARDADRTQSGGGKRGIKRKITLGVPGITPAVRWLKY
jgi:hypothetical protein